MLVVMVKRSDLSFASENTPDRGLCLPQLQVLFFNMSAVPPWPSNCPWTLKTTKKVKSWEAQGSLSSVVHPIRTVQEEESTSYTQACILLNQLKNLQNIDLQTF